MAYTDGITINGVHSYADMGLHISGRKIDLPSKRIIRKTVPFMNGSYNFTKLNGDVTWGDRTISYTFDIIGETVEEMDAKRTEVVNWFCNMDEVDIYDDTIPDYHFHGSYETPSQNEDAEKTELTITFNCYPFMIANEPQSMYIGGEFTVTNTGQAVRPYLEASQAAAITIGGMSQSAPAGETRLALTLPSGEVRANIAKENEMRSPWQEATHTENGITFTVASDGKITANGTATGVAWFYLRGAANLFKPPVGRHRFYGCPAGGNANTYRVQVYAYHGDTEAPVYTYDYGSGGIVDVKENTVYLSIAIRIASGYVANNLVFNPSMYGVTMLKWYNEVL